MTRVSKPCPDRKAVGGTCDFPVCASAGSEFEFTSGNCFILECSSSPSIFEYLVSISYQDTSHSSIREAAVLCRLGHYSNSRDLLTYLIFES